MAHGERTAAALSGGAAGAAAGPIGAGVGAAAGYIAASLGSLFGKKKKAPAPPKPVNWFSSPTHLAIVAGSVVGGVLLFVAFKKKG